MYVYLMSASLAVAIILGSEPLLYEDCVDRDTMR